MLRSLYSGVSGMRNNQTKMDVIGNNISNSTTTAFKSGRVKFQDMFSQTLADAQKPTEAGKGGTNPKQVGLGMSVSSIDTIMTGGAMQPTGRDLDFAIEGEGFFIVTPDGGDTTEGRTNYYTRDGAFYTDFEGNLVTASGMRILGYTSGQPEDSIDPPEPITETPTDDTALDELQAIKIPNSTEDGQLEAWSVDGTGLITAVYGGQTKYIGYIGMAKFQNTSGLEKVGGNCYTATNNSGYATPGVGDANGYGTIKQSTLEMSNVDLANEFTEMIITSRAYQANSRTITTSDEMLQELLNLKR